MNLKFLRRAVAITSEDGIGTLAKKVIPYSYQQLWPHLPTGSEIRKNKIKSSKHRRLTDGFLPSYVTKYVPTDDPTYEEQYIDCIRRYIDSGEQVVMIGGGDGISTVAVARQVGPAGAVSVFEGGGVSVDRTRKTTYINDVADRVTVTHAIVAEDYHLRTAADGAEYVSPSELPECDTICIDADGAELPILRALAIQPFRLVVEHHAVPGENQLTVEYQPDTVRKLLKEHGYEIVEEIADPTAAYGSYEERIFVAER